MKKSELKSIIKECVKEVLFEEGVLSNLVAEITFGVTKAQGLIAESKVSTLEAANADRRLREERDQKKKLLETKKKMIDAIGGDRMSGVFEGTKPLPNSGGSNPHSPLAGKDPGDAGVDISGLFKLSGQRWQDLK